MLQFAIFFLLLFNYLLLLFGCCYFLLMRLCMSECVYICTFAIALRCFQWMCMNMYGCMHACMVVCGWVFLLWTQEIKIIIIIINLRLVIHFATNGNDKWKNRLEVSCPNCVAADMYSIFPIYIIYISNGTHRSRFRFTSFFFIICKYL